MRSILFIILLSILSSFSSLSAQTPQQAQQALTDANQYCLDVIHWANENDFGVISARKAYEEVRAEWAKAVEENAVNKEELYRIQFEAENFYHKTLYAQPRVAEAKKALKLARSEAMKFENQ